MLMVVLDAGHGPNTAGKRTPDGSMREYHFNSDVAKRTRELLLGYENVSVLFTHEDARDVPLKERTDKANAWGGDVLFSIHANAHGEGGWTSVRGVETFSWNGPSPNGDALAAEMQKQLMDHTKHPVNRGAKKENFHMLREFKKAACLLECGFMTNREDAELLKSSAYRQRCAEAIVKTLEVRYGIKKKPAPKPTPVAPKGTWRVVTGSFQDKTNAEQRQKDLKAKGFDSFLLFDQN